VSRDWDRIFLRKALDWARESKDPNTRVGSIIVGPDREVRASGFNGLPRGVADTPERLNDREMKLKLTVHAERNAICTAARIGTALKGCRLYLAAFSVDSPDVVYGGAPCTACAIEIIQAGITEVVSYPFKEGFSRWREDIEFAKDILQEAGLTYREIC
jgi:dCMP deaminase